MWRPSNSSLVVSTSHGTSRFAPRDADYQAAGGEHANRCRIEEFINPRDLMNKKNSAKHRTVPFQDPGNIVDRLPDAHHPIPVDRMI